MKDTSSAAVSLVSMKDFGGAVLARRSVQDGQSLQPGDPAVHAITDFMREYPVTVDAERQIDDALNDMIRLGVRALLVANGQHLAGLITSYDIQGEKPIQFLQSLLVIEVDKKNSTSTVRALASRTRLVLQLKGSRRTG
jgi:CBS domain-containing protein